MSKLVIELVDWDPECGDGCCSDYGTMLVMNGEELEHPDYSPEECMTNRYIGMNVRQSLEAVLKKLGYEVEVIERQEE
jgi:hypothetical protein